jgi:pyruvate dehydrogenase E2 component (dihydrolipoamide acetyltransferase)
MPALSPTMTQGNVGKWKVSVGDSVSPGDVLVEIETDKAQMDFECQEEGWIAKIIKQGPEKNVAVNTPLAILVDEKEDIQKFTDFKLDIKDNVSTNIDIKEDAIVKDKPSTNAPQDKTTGNRIFSSPAAKFAAIKNDIDISLVSGTGPLGRILKTDVNTYKPSIEVKTQPPIKSSKPQTTLPIPSGTSYKDLPLTPIRKVIASRLTESKSTIPHYYLTIELKVDRVLK